MITRAEILMGREVEYPLNPILESNLNILLTRLNKLRQLFGKPMRVSSGYRPGRFNKAKAMGTKHDGAKDSAHLYCMAVDFYDPNRELVKFCMANKGAILKQCGLYMEKPSQTPTWCHLQIRPTKNRIFGK